MRELSREGSTIGGKRPQRAVSLEGVCCGGDGWWWLSVCCDAVVHW